MIVITFLLLVIGAMASSYLRLGLNSNLLLVKNSDAFDFHETSYYYDEVGPPGYIVFNNVDYSDTENLQIM